MAARKMFRGVLALLAALLIGSQARAADVTGAGSTFAYPLIAKWAEAYKSKTGVSVNYQSIRSGGGTDA